MEKSSLFSLFFGAYLICNGLIPATSANQATLDWLSAITSNYANALSENVLQITSQNSKLQQIYTETNPTVVTIKPDTILQTKISAFSLLLQEADDKVQKLTKEAETSFAAFGDSRELTNEDVRFYYMSGTNGSNPNITLYYNAKCTCGHQLPDGYDEHDCTEPQGGFTTSETYAGLNISAQSSAVHIPLDVYNEDSKVLSDIRWTKFLDAFGQNQSCASGRTKWSFVATDNGVFRYFPGRKWNLPCPDIDVYDARGRNWFVQSVSSTKDVLIMIDTSGSVIGLTLNLINHSVRHLMDTLTENDFFNIFVFNENATLIHPECPGLIQALPRNKEAAFGWLKSIAVRNASSFNTGFDFAFNLLNISRPLSASCNPIILLLTDGGAEYPSKAFDQWNLSKETRVFTYSVGKHFSSTASLKEMACNNRGVFAAIPSNSATHVVTKQYLSKISKALAYSDTKKTHWTLPYEDVLGLGGVITASRPVYRPTSDDELAVKAVVGCDILYDDVKAVLDVSGLGANSYIFGIENNGLLFYHPKLGKARLGVHSAIDIAEIDVINNTLDVSKMTQIRQSMIEGKGSSGEEGTANVLSDDRKHISTATYRYYYAPVPSTLFSLSLAVPLSNLHRYSGTSPVTSLSQLLVNNASVYSQVCGLRCLRDASSCNSDTGATSGGICASMQMVVDGSACEGGIEPSQVSEVLLHGWVSKEFLARHWLSSASHNAVRSVFIATDSSPSVLRVQHLQKDQISKEIESILSDPFAKDYFKRPLLTTETIYTVAKVSMTSQMTWPVTETTTMTSFTSAPPTTFESYTGTTAYIQPEETMNLIVASRGVTLTTTSPQVTPAVTGEVLDPLTLRDMLFNMTSPTATGSPGCQGSLFCNCWEKEDLCIVLDDGAQLIMSNQDDQQHKVGGFYGSIDGQLIKSLERDGVYVMRQVINYQVVCNRSDNVDSASSRSYVIPTLTGIVKFGHSMVTSSLLSLRNLVALALTSLMTSAWGDVVQTYPFSASETSESNYRYAKKHCVFRNAVFEFGSGVGVFEGEIPCGETCNRTYAASRIPGTNLLMVTADICSPSCFTEYPRDVMESDVTAEMACAPQRFRKAPSEICYDTRTLPEELDKDCGAAKLSPLSSVLLVALATVLTQLTTR